MNKNKYAGLLFLVIALVSCRNQKHDAVKSPHKIIKFELAGAAEVETNIWNKYLKDAYINFYKDKVGILTDSGKYITGVCKYQEAGGLWNIKVDSLEGMMLTISRYEQKAGIERTVMEGNTLSGKGIKAVMEYDSYYEYEHIDQLSPAANKWRAIPVARQSEGEIKNRVTGQLHYIRDYFRMLHDRKDGYFNGKHLNAPFDFYSNGLGLKGPEYRKEWNNMFFDTTDARRGFEMLEDALNHVRTKLIVEETPSGIYNNVIDQMLHYIEA